jgi:hypothetical protein
MRSSLAQRLAVTSNPKGRKLKISPRMLAKANLNAHQEGTKIDFQSKRQKYLVVQHALTEYTSELRTSTPHLKFSAAEKLS